LPTMASGLSIATNTVRMLYPEAMVGNYGLPEAAGYNNERCRQTATAEEAEDWFRASGYRMVKRMEWPKALWTRLQLGPWVACLKSDRSGLYITPGFETDAPNYDARLKADAAARWGSADYVQCDYGPTREYVERRVRNHYTSTPSDWPLPWLGERRATAPPPKPQTSSKPAAVGALTVKTDTSLRDAGKAWDDQVKKTLAAEAQKKVELAAKKVRDDQKYKADMEAFFAERRRQGSRQ